MFTLTPVLPQTEPEVKQPFGAKDPILPDEMFTPIIYTNIHDHRWDNLFIYTNDIYNTELENIDGLYLAGGSLRNLLGGKDVIADIDIFFRDMESLRKAIKVMDEDNNWYEVFRCPANELITFKTVIDKADEDKTDEDYKNQKKIQFITKSFYTNPNELINSFDFVPTCACYYKGALYTHPDWLKSVRKRMLYLHFVSFPVATINRMMKYRDKGYIVPSDTVLSMVQEINQGDFDGDRLALYID